MATITCTTVGTGVLHSVASGAAFDAGANVLDTGIRVDRLDPNEDGSNFEIEDLFSGTTFTVGAWDFSNPTASVAYTAAGAGAGTVTVKVTYRHSATR